MKHLLTVAAILAGTLVHAQSANTAAAIDIGPPPGRLVDIGGRRLHLDCRGTGAPTVVIEAGGSAFALDWALVQPQVAKGTRTCAYDRARHGWSDPSPSAEMPANVASDLQLLLERAGEKPPFVLVGHSMGGIYARIFERRHPADVVGLVLVDPSHESSLFTLFEGKPVTIASLTAEQLRTTMPSGDISVPSRAPQAGPPFDRLPPDLFRRRVELERLLIAGDSSKPVPAAVVSEAMEGQRAALAELDQAARLATPLGNRPLVVLTRGRQTNAGLQSAHASLAASSTNSRHRIVEDAGHEIHLDRPDVVIQAIEDVVDAVRRGDALRAR